MKIVEGGEERRPLLVERRVAGSGQYDKPGARDQRAVGLAEFWWHEAVHLAPDEQGRHVDAMQPLAEIGVVETRPVGQPRHGRAILRDQLRVDFRHVADPPRRAFLIGVKAA